MERESEEANGSKIGRELHNLKSIPGTQWLLWDEVIPFWARPRSLEKGTVGTQRSWCGANRRRGRGLSPFKELWRDSDSLLPPRQSWFEESFKGFVWGRGFKLGGAGSLVADETDAPEGIAGPHLLTSSQLPSETAWKAIIALFE